MSSAEKDISHASDVEITDAFRSMSGEGGTIKSDMAAILARELGHAPSLGEINAFVERVGSECDKVAFKNFYIQVSHPEDNFEELVQLFMFYDVEGTGKITKKVLCMIMQSFGEPFDKNEMANFLKDMCDDEDEVDYRKLVSKLLVK